MSQISTRHRTAIKHAIRREVDRQRIYLLRKVAQSPDWKGWVSATEADNCMESLVHRIESECMEVLKTSDE